MGSAYFEAGGAQSPLKVAWGQVNADVSIVVHGLFRNNAGGTHYEAAVASTAGAMALEIPFDATTFAPSNVPMYTGLAIANLDTANSANISCSAREGSGNLIDNGVTIPSIKPLGHWANYIFPALTGRRGTLDCVSTTKVGVTALRFLGTAAFSSLPVILEVKFQAPAGYVFTTVPPSCGLNAG